MNDDVRIVPDELPDFGQVLKVFLGDRWVGMVVPTYVEERIGPVWLAYVEGGGNGRDSQEEAIAAVVEYGHSHPDFVMR